MKAASILWRLSLAAFLLMLTWQVWQLRRAPQWAAAQIERQAGETRAAALAAITSTRHDLVAQTNALLAQTTALRADLLPRVDRLIDLSDRHLDDLTARVDSQLTAANASIAEVSKLRGDVGLLLPPIRNTLDVASENADLLGRCATQDAETGEWIGNPDCLANRLIPALKNMEHMAAAGERMAAAIEKETPATAAAVKGTSQSVAAIAANFARPASWVKGVLLTAARVAGKWFGF